MKSQSNFLTNKKGEQIKLLDLHCNCTWHIGGGQFSKSLAYLFKLPKQLIRDPNYPPLFCEECMWELRQDENHNWRWTGTLVTHLQKKFLCLADFIDDKDVFQLAKNEQIFKNVRLTKKLKKLFKALRQNSSFKSKLNFQNFINYCQNRKVFQVLEDDAFHSSIIEEGIKCFKKVQQEVLIQDQINPLKEFPLNYKGDKNLFYQIQEGMLFQYYESKHSFIVDVFDYETGIFKLKIKFQMSSLYTNYNSQLQVTQDKKFLCLLANYTELYVYNFETQQYMNCGFDLMRKDRNIFIFENEIYLLSSNKLMKVDYESLSIKDNLDFSDVIIKNYNYGIHYHEKRKILFILFHNELALINLQNFQFINSTKHFGLKHISITQANDFIMSDINDLLYYAKINDIYVTITVYSCQSKRIIRNFKIFNDDWIIQMKLSFFKEQLALTIGNKIAIFNVQTGSKILEKTFKCNSRCRFPIQVHQEKMISIAEKETIKVLN